MKTKLLLLGFIFFFLAFFSNVSAVGTFIPAANRIDMVHDANRDVIYITNGGSVLRYNTTNNTFLTPFVLGGNLGGIDLSPDGNTLAVADRTRSDTQVWIHLIDLQTEAGQKVYFPKAFSEGGTFTVAFGNDGTLFISSTYDGSGTVPFRRYFPQTGTTSTLGSITQNSMLTPSGNAEIIGFEESNSSDGPFGRFRISDNNLLRKNGYTNGTSWFNYEIGVNANGTQYAIPTYGGTFITDANLVKLPTVIGTYAGAQPIGVVYHPVENLVYFSWANTSQIKEFETTSLLQSGTYDFESTFTSNGNFAFVNGRLKISRDGSLLMCSVPGGVRFYRMYSPLSVENQSLSLNKNDSLPVTISASIGNSSGLNYSLVSGPAHGTLSGTLPYVTYTPAPNYSGADEFVVEVKYGRAAVRGTISLTVVNTNTPPIVNDQTVTTTEDTPKVMVLAGTDSDGDPLTFSVLTSPTQGVLSGSGANLTYTPNPNYFGTDSFTYKANDGQEDSAPATVTIIITPQNDAPVANSDIATTVKNVSITVNVLSNDTDIDGDALTVAVATTPRNGTATVNSTNKIIYVPRNGFTGTDTFTYRIQDPGGATSTAYVTVRVLRR